MLSSQLKADLLIDDFSTPVTQIESSVNTSFEETSASTSHTVMTIAGQRYLLAEAKGSFGPGFFFETGTSLVEVASNQLSIDLSNTPDSFAPPDTAAFGIEFPSASVVYDNFGVLDFTSFTETAFKIEFASAANADVHILLKDGNGDESVAFASVTDMVGSQSILFDINNDFAAIVNAAALTNIVSIQLRVDLTNTDTSGGNQMAAAEIANLSYVVNIPEPGMLGLTGLGVICAACYRRRKYDSVQYETKDSGIQERF